MHDDGPQVILPVPGTAKRVEERLRKAQAILAEAGFRGVRLEEYEETLLIAIEPGDLTRLQDEQFREGLVARLKSLGYAFAAIELTPGGAGAAASGAPA
jgi:hypothetical protein